jgi:hypothetical protein
MMDLSTNSVAKEVAQALAFARETNGVPMVVTPLLYPGGGRVVLRLEDSREGYIVSDYGAGRREAELMGGGTIYNAIAKRAAERFAVRYDSHMLFELEVPREALVTAAIAVANASQHAVTGTAETLSERRAQDQRSMLFNILKGVYPKDSIHLGQRFSGHSDSWEFDAVVITPQRPALFQIVTPYPAAVNAAVVKFLDVKDAGADKTIRVAVPTSVEKTPHIQLLARTARIVAMDAPASSFKLTA